MAVDPVSGCELLKQRLVEATRCPEVDILDAGVLAQRGCLETGAEALVVPFVNRRAKRTPFSG